MRIQFVGLGGIGGWLFPPFVTEVLTRKGSLELHLWDGDEVSQSNLLRQNFVAGDVGAAKVEVFESIAMTLGGKRLKVEAHEEFVGMKNFAKTFAKGDIIIGCPDNHAARRLLLEIGLRLSCPVFLGGNEAADGNVIYQGARDECHSYIRTRHPEIFAPEKGRDEMSCAELAALPGGGQTLAANHMAATLLLTMFTDYIYDKRRLPADIYFTVSPPTVRSVDYPSSRKFITDLRTKSKIVIPMGKAKKKAADAPKPEEQLKKDPPKCAMCGTILRRPLGVGGMLKVGQRCDGCNVDNVQWECSACNHHFGHIEGYDDEPAAMPF